MNIAWISKIESDMPHKTSRLKLSKALQKRGHSVTLYMVRKFGEKTISQNNIVCIPTFHYPILSGLFYGVIVFFYFPVLLKRKNVDIIIVDFTKVSVPFVIPLKVLNKLIIFDIRTLPIDRDNSFFFNFWMYLSKYVADGFTTITPELKDIMIKDYNITDIKIGLWSSGASIDDFKNDSLNKTYFNETALKDHKFILMYHGWYSPTRGIENLINAIEKLDIYIKNKIKLFIIGMPNNKINNLSQLCKDKEVSEQVVILPKISYKEITQFLKIADIGIVPLPPEHKWWYVSAPLKTLEYLAAGKPVVATNIPFHYKIFKKGNCGVLIDSGSPKDIAKGIIYLYNKRKILIKMGKEGREIVKNDYTWDIIAQKVEDFLKELIM
jgi:glycosyltransferase involved in cell wall biosynthesis